MFEHHKLMQRARADDTGFPQLHSQLPLNLLRISALTFRALMMVLQNKLNNTLTDNVVVQVRTFKNIPGRVRRRAEEEKLQAEDHA